MRGLVSTLVLVVVAAALLSYIYFMDAPAPGEVRDRVFTVEAADIEEVTVTSSGETTIVRKTDGGWRLVSPTEAEADETEVTSLTGQLAGLEISRVVDEDAADLAQYGLADPQVAVAFRAGDASGRLRLGDQTPTTVDMYAAREGETRVFLIPAFLESTFARSPFDLRDKRILRVERAEVDAVEISGSGRTIQLARTGSEWRLTAPYAARGDYGAIEGLVTRVTSAPMASLVAEEAGPLGEFGLDRPALTVRIGSGSASAVLQVGREADGRVFARDASRTLVFTIDKTLADDLDKPAEDYRSKDLFAFRLFNAERLVVTRGSDRAEFEKRSGQGEEPAEGWQRVEGPETHTSLVEDLLTRLVNLRAESFTGTADSTGLSAPELVVEVTYDEGKTERVSFGRSANEVFAARADEPGAARVDVGAFGEALDAVSVVTAPATDTQPSP